MQRSRLRLAIYASAAVLAVVGGVGAAVAATTPAAGVLSATFSKDSDWGTGYQAKYIITNGTGATVNGWKTPCGMRQMKNAGGSRRSCTMASVRSSPGSPCLRMDW